MKDFISIRGARQHNLKNINLDIPRNKLVVITGVSGSGKSSLAFDTLFAEGQRRYVESLSAYARQFLEQMDKPDVDVIEGLSPAISIEQKTVSKNPRSTVGTVTEIYDYLRLLYASIGEVFCPDCRIPIAGQTVQQMVDRILSLPGGTRFLVLAPLTQAKKGEHRKLFEQMAREGFVRARVNGEIIEVANPPELDKKKKHTIEVVVDRLEVRQDLAQRLADSLETALRVGDGLVRIAPKDREEFVLSSRHACPQCGFSLAELSPRLFSFNSPQGACPSCTGLGSVQEIDPGKLILDPQRSLAAGAVAGIAESGRSFRWRQLQTLAKAMGFSLHVPWYKLPEPVQRAILYGTTQELHFEFVGERSTWAYRAPFEGLVPALERKYRETRSPEVRAEIERFMSQKPCPACGGRRLRREALAVHIRGKNIHDVVELSVRESLKFFQSLELTPREQQIAGKILKEINDRLEFLAAVGLDYLTLSRTSGTLSGGEAQRIRLATQIGSKLMGVLYVLDEPSIGLHQRDNRKLLATLKGMRDLGNTVLVVEHDEETMREADWIVDLGPGAGIHGGEVVAEGPPEVIPSFPRSLTGRYLAGELTIPVPPKRRPGNGKKLVVYGAREHNLKNLDVAFPLGMFICVTGVSGSGKSTLVNEILYKACARSLYRALELPGAHDRLEGTEFIDKVVAIDQSPIGRTPRSNPATYTKVFDPIRELFALTPEARARGYKPGRFSFNVRGGRCEACAGEGQIKIEMHFLPDVYVTCDVCKGRRYSRETLEVHYKGLSIAEVLDLTVEQARELFAAHPHITRILDTLMAVGLGYIKLGQPATTLSGGEAQRIKLSRELARRATGQTLYILDEPTTGLHFDDVKKLLSVLHTLVDRGNTVVVIEHNLDVIKTADWIIDLGPEGGDEGGFLVAQGTPEQVAQNGQSWTGRYLAPLLSLPKAQAC
ncbi:excinuclease ABC subunit A [Thermoanaerobaculum aquaticum]|uniref:UvrABC system protein A n=1 Tax=Thermoanaerobaculum aquaticum TaxID=1312852 RepID=A0A062XRC0_9BACT|nr:excinuclease ABC subunit UvrA [Thermoanaerobaculum aquaticum]KDA53363.1 excinuclease ABC subunit A [Thermoanaerobaculum aquaticum]